MTSRSVLYEFFNQLNILTESEIEVLISKFYPEVYQPKSIILNKGDINDKLYIVEYGVVREFSYNEESQKLEQTFTHWMGGEGTIVYVVESFLTGTPSKISIDVLEKTKLWAIKKEDLDEIYEKYPSVNYLGRILTENYLAKYESFIFMLRLPPEDRFDWFDAYHKDLINRVPLKYVASYLNMTPETLSRIRTKRAKFKK